MKFKEVDLRLLEIRERLSNASEGSWTHDDHGWKGDYVTFPGDPHILFADGWDFTATLNGVHNPGPVHPQRLSDNVEYMRAMYANGLFLAHAREDIPYLLDKIDVEDERIEEIRKREAAATEGPWDFEDLEWDGCHISLPNNPHIIFSDGWDFGANLPQAQYRNVKPTKDESLAFMEEMKCNFRFLAHSREDIPYLLDLLEP